MRGAFGCLRTYEDALMTMTVHSLFRAMVLHMHQPHNKFNRQKGEVELEFRCGVFHSKRSQRNRLNIDVASPAIIAPSEKIRYEFESGLTELELTSIISHLWNDKLARKSELEAVTERAYIATDKNKRILYYPFYESAQLESFAETSSFHKEQEGKEQSAVDEQEQQQLQKQQYHSTQNAASDTATSKESEEVKIMEEKRAMETINFLRSAARKTARSYKIHSAIAKERVSVHDISLPNWSFDMRLALSLEKPIAMFKNEMQKEQKLQECQTLHHNESTIPHESEQYKQAEQRRNTISNEGNELVVLDECAVSLISQYLVKTIHIHPFFHLQLSRRCDCLDSDVYHLNRVTEVITIPTLHRPLLFFHCELEFNIDAIYKEWRRLTGCRLDLPVFDDDNALYHKANSTAHDARRSAIHEKAIRDPFLRQVASDALTILQYIGTECT